MGKSTLYYHEEYVKELESKINDLEKELKRLKENDNLLDRIEELEKENIVGKTKNLEDRVSFLEQVYIADLKSRISESKLIRNADVMYFMYLMDNYG